MLVKTIEPGRYDGYKILSDKGDITILHGDSGEEIIEQLDSPNDKTFIIESQLYDKEKRLSYHIRYVDGEYMITRTQVDEDVINSRSNRIVYSDFPSDEHKIQSCFVEIWKTSKDALCENMETLVYSKRVFIGFKNI